jgi:hypothetical protein
MYTMKSLIKWPQRMFRLRKSSEWRRRAHNESEVSLYYKVGEASNIHDRARLLWTLTLAPITGKVWQQRSDDEKQRYFFLIKAQKFHEEYRYRLTVWCLYSYSLTSLYQVARLTSVEFFMKEEKQRSREEEK